MRSGQGEREKNRIRIVFKVNLENRNNEVGLYARRAMKISDPYRKKWVKNVNLIKRLGSKRHEKRYELQTRAKRAANCEKELH